MQNIFTQIYEIQTPEEAQQVVAAGVDHIGSVVVSGKEWKQPLIKETIRFVEQSKAKSSLILLFNDQATVFSALDYYRPDMVHFCEVLMDTHMENTVEKVCRPLIDLQKKIRKNFPKIKIMRTIPIPINGGLNEVPFLDLAKLFEPVSDYFLTDTLIAGDAEGKNQPVDGYVGITGKTCDWQAAAKLVDASRIPVILAGGLSCENVFDGIMTVKPAGVDSCTMTNACDDSGAPIRFKKDMEKVKKFVKEAKRALNSIKSMPLT
ncbi:MAG: phosphoribosylanthranilate isomerase [Dissulfuribacterales bacterium]